MPYTESGLWIPRELKKDQAPPRPHWTTFVTPVLSLFVAFSSLVVSGLTWYLNTKIAGSTQRPFVTVAVKQTAPFFDGDGKKHHATFEVSLANTGNVEATAVGFDITPSKNIECTSSMADGPYDIAPHASTTRSLRCTFSEATIPTLKNIDLVGVLAYGDDFHEQFTEAHLIRPLFQMTDDPIRRER